MTKAIIMREISFTYSSESQKESRNRVMNSFKCYWKKGKPDYISDGWQEESPLIINKENQITSIF